MNQGLFRYSPAIFRRLVLLSLILFISRDSTGTEGIPSVTAPPASFFETVANRVGR